MLLERTCERCHKKFLKNKNVSLKEWNQHYRFCSWKCLKNPIIACLICKTKFRPRGKRVKTAKYCSYSCARKGQLNYKGGVSRDPNPSQFSFGQRQRIWKRDSSTCKDCGVKEKDMVVHHMTFTKEVLPDNLLVLVCRSCHHRRHYEHDKLKLIKV